ncbi:MAG TPA: PHB depolymerase family esterase [Puia sp.]|nr:PHB depolymerase family esterase [Puia sp.]
MSQLVKKIPSSLILLLVLCSACKKTNTTPPPPGDAGYYTDSMTIDGNVRSFIVTLPKGWNTETLPLVFALHGGGGTAQGMETLTGLESLAISENFILVYPQGIQNSWNDGRPTAANQLGIDDVKFFNSMVTYLSSKYKINSKMIYCTGISNGGFMTSTLAFKLSNIFSACAVDAATIDSVVITGNPATTVSMMFLHGTDDPIVSYYGGTTTIGEATSGVFVSHDQAVQRWVDINKCAASPVLTNIPDSAGDGTSIVESDYKNGLKGTEVVGYSIYNGGHTWPNGWQYLPAIVIGKTTRNLDANTTIWNFFKSHPKQ